MPRLLAILGPTATGKSALADRVRDRWGAPTILVADAFQSYRGFRVGTGQRTDRGRALTAFKAPTDDYGAGEFVRLALPILEGAFARGEDLILEGGTGFYVRALLEGYDALSPAPDPALRARLLAEPIESLVARLPPEIAAKTDLKNPVRVRRALERLAGPPPERFTLPPFDVRKVALTGSEPDRHAETIAARVTAMLAEGWPEEVRALLASGVPESAPAFRAIGYRTVAAMLRGEIGEEAARESVVKETVRYAKRQKTWLRSEPRLSILPEGDFFIGVESLFASRE